MNLNRYYKRSVDESVFELSKRVDELKALQRKFDPSLLVSDTQMSRNERCAVYEMLEEVMMHIEILDKDIYGYWRTKKSKRKFRFWK